ncbi:phosphate signaling complex protein PhoU [Tundrisphaera lichenicola]|uniref:phosphate signaling complex protein PhoU n=1 Tax=Tundrisphaera lichenicola TaxID=2029860 RepID=UPI003EBA8E9B
MQNVEGAAAWGEDWHAERATLGRHFLRDMEGLWHQILKLAAVVETTLNTSVRALCDGRADLAADVKSEEQSIDRWEVQIERDCLKVLALHQPVASDLRRVAAILRINSDLERMADLARHIAKRARKLTEEPIGRALPRNLEVMASEAMDQVRESLDALTQGDVTLARAVIANDRKVDRHRRSVVEELKQAIRDDPDHLDGWLRLINATRNLERVADHATNIAEAVIYLKEGDIIRHDTSTGRFSKPMS